MVRGSLSCTAWLMAWRMASPRLLSHCPTSDWAGVVILEQHPSSWHSTQPALTLHFAPPASALLAGALAGLAKAAKQLGPLPTYCKGYFDSLLRLASPPPPFPSPPPPSPPLLENRYAEALRLSLQFYEAQQSGVLAPWNRFLRSAGGFRSNSHLQDGGTARLDLTGGYYDAGDTLKFTLPLGVAMSVLAWGGVQFRSAYLATGQMPVLMRTVKWGVDWMVKAHFAASDVPSQNQLVVQVRLSYSSEQRACAWS